MLIFVHTVILLCRTCAPALAGFSSPVLSVLDGDLIKVLHNKRPQRVRLHGIDCPEKKQAFGQRAKEAASALVFGKEVTLQTYGKDKYGRTIADVLLPDGTSVNHTLVKEGWCWWYRKYAPGDAELGKLEKGAREARRGLWADPQPVPGLEVSRRHLLQDAVIEGEIHHEASEPRVLLFQALQAFGLIDAEPTIFLLPPIVGLLRDPEFPASLDDRQPFPISISIVRRCPMISSAMYHFRAIAPSFFGQRPNSSAGLA